MSFNKEKFAALLGQAKGKRSINKFGVDTGVDPGYISRLMRSLVANAPSANVINKLASKADNQVSVRQLMEAAGYLEQPEEIAEGAASYRFERHDNPEVQRFIRDFLDAPQEQQVEMMKVWRIMKEVEKQNGVDKG
ncbi:hypothetical protein [Paenibacillus sp. MSJ-34]|uniref:hypothetical protein n=1 Tax=Paenibacillus sp. MSJ-34 TaxID=2841529 RepID=UPI001C112CE4|nr:hypothetical protein [Paenibacillus sp. MSJ-34]MBU5440659.1 hypothetical protein [Paenibacillus sp. MSJ-34]